MDHGLGDSHKTVIAVATMEATQQKKEKNAIWLLIMK